jgi:predicted NUDIX family phosphoesterase
MAGVGEQILVVDRAARFGGDWPQGFHPMRGGDAQRFLTALATDAFAVDRATAEQNPAWKQPIPYCVTRCGGDVLFVRRLKRQSESRLHDLWSCGIGGHVHPDDQRSAARGVRVPSDLWVDALRRELDEELILAPHAGQPRFLGLLNDDSTEVGRVHFGLVYDLPVESGAFLGVREIHKMCGDFVPVLRPGVRHLPERVVGSKTLWQDPPRFESWTTILIDALPWAQPATEDPEKVGQA